MSESEVDRLKAELTAEKKRADDNWQRHVASCVKYGHTFKALIDERAKLGRAVAAFSRYREYGKAWVDAMSETSRSQAERGAGNVRALEAEFDAILTDAGTQAAEAYTAEREVIEAAKAFRASGVPHEHWVRLWNALDALAAVEARRGGAR